LLSNPAGVAIHFNDTLTAAACRTEHNLIKDASALSNNSRNPGSFQTLLAEQASANSRLFFKLAHGVLREAMAAEDVCQHAFLKAWERQDQLTNAKALRAWLAKVIVNESLRLLRRRRVEQRAMTDARLTAASPAASSAGDAELRESVTAAIAALPEPTRLIVSLRMQSGLSGNEVKEIVGCSAAEVSRQLHAGMDMLRKQLSPYKDVELGVGHAM
jgi:RNA polymerase sigma-70 factor, ECF subfamily